MVLQGICQENTAEHKANKQNYFRVSVSNDVCHQNVTNSDKILTTLTTQEEGNIKKTSGQLVRSGPEAMGKYPS